MQQVRKYLTNLGYRITPCQTATGEYLVAAIGSHTRRMAMYASWGRQTGGQPVEVQNGRLFAPGVAEYRAGLAAVLSVAEHVAKFRLPVTFVLGADAGASTDNLAEHPWVRTSDMVLVVGAAAAAAGPFAVYFGRKGTAELGITVRSADGAVRQRQAAEIVSWIETMKFRHCEPFGMARVIVNANSVIIPGSGTYDAVVSLATTPVDTADRISTFLTIAADDYGIDARVEQVAGHTPYPDAYAVDVNNRYVRLLDRNIFSGRGITPGYADTAGEENALAQSLPAPVVSLAPVGGYEQGREWVEVGSLHQLTRSLASAADVYAAHTATAFH